MKSYVKGIKKIRHKLMKHIYRFSNEEYWYMLDMLNAYIGLLNGLRKYGDYIRYPNGISDYRFIKLIDTIISASQSIERCIDGIENHASIYVECELALNDAIRELDDNSYGDE